MIQVNRRLLRRRETPRLQVGLWLRNGVMLAFLAWNFLIVDKINAQTYSEGRNEEDVSSVSDEKERAYKANGTSQVTEHIRVRGVGTTPAELISGSRANYLQKDVDLGALGKQKSVLAPFSMMTTTHDVIMDQQLRTIGQTVQYMPSVNLEDRGNGVFRLINRGYESDVEQNSRIDGLNAIITTPYATEQFDSVTVLNGAAASIYGPQSPAGMLLMTQKRPTDKPFFNFNFAYDSNGSPMESLDTSLGKGPVKVRFNYLNQTGQSYTSNSNQWRDLYSGAIDVQLTKHTKLELNGSQYNNAIFGLPGLFVIGTGVDKLTGRQVSNVLPGAPNSNFPGYGTNDTGISASTSVGTMVLKHDFTKTLHLKLGGLYEDAARESLSANNTILAPVNGGGYDYSQTLQSSAAANDFKTWSNFAHLNWDMTDPVLHIRHHLNVGTTGYSLDNFNPVHALIGETGKATIPVGIGNLYDPSLGMISSAIDSNGNAFGSGQVAPGAYWNNAQGRFKSAALTVQNVMFGDSFDIGDYFTVMGQMSWGWIQQYNYNSPASKNYAVNGPLQGVSRTNGAFDPTVALTFHPTKRFSAYFNWGQDTAPGTGYAITSQTAGVTEQAFTPPARSTQYEGAIKYLWKDRFLVTLGGFAMSRPYTIGNNANFLGNQNDMGMEFQVSGALTKELSMYGGVTYDNARYHCTDYAACALQYGGGKKSTDFLQNSQVVGVAPWQSDFLLDWHPAWLRGVSFNSNIHYQGARAANANNTSYADDYVTLDLGVRYVTHIVDHMLVFRGNIDNVTNQNYWASLWSKNQSGTSTGGYSEGVGAPQTWHVSASIYF